MWRVAALIGLLVSGQAFAEGTTAPVYKWTLLDQRDNAYTLNNDAKVLLVARSMSAAKLLNAAIEDQPEGYLEARHAVYVADIEKMPSMIKLVAVPAMRSAKYRILLDQDGRVATRYGGDRESVQWLTLKDGVVVNEQRFTDAEKLKQAVELAK
ncbi:hypothetical protein AUC61_17830 [Pseudomonas sp. S25]|uniref:FAD/FMN-containing dehydrogenase n=1 Tax=Pseudomonas maioricensis TaxID=1766623 RepID=A0ABS9ZLD5_9PSED|nr:hypothetical protein [Pseudomonas sp. S25]MCI8211391.1 hypothetical protein [Pseudomonas sp. S25]